MKKSVLWSIPTEDFYELHDHFYHLLSTGNRDPYDFTITLLEKYNVRKKKTKGESEK